MAQFTPATLAALFPLERSQAFFDALYGEAEEGAYDIHLVFHAEEEQVLRFSFELRQRPGKCLVCSLTHGLPGVFERHPVIDLRGLVAALGREAGWPAEAIWWRIGSTEQISTALHRIPLALMRYDPATDKADSSRSRS